MGRLSTTECTYLPTLSCLQKGCAVDNADLFRVSESQVRRIWETAATPKGIVEEWRSDLFAGAFLQFVSVPCKECACIVDPPLKELPLNTEQRRSERLREVELPAVKAEMTAKAKGQPKPKPPPKRKKPSEPKPPAPKARRDEARKQTEGPEGKDAEGGGRTSKEAFGRPVGRSFVNDDPVFRTCETWQIATGPANCEARSLPGWADYRYRRRGGFGGCSHLWRCHNAFRGGHAAPKSRSAAGSCANARCHAHGHAHASHERPPDADAHASHAAHAVNAPNAAYAVNAPHAANAAHAAHAAALLSTEQHAALWLSYVQAVL